MIALCSTDNNLSNVDLVIPINNKGRRSLAIAYWLLARQLKRELKELTPEQEFSASIDDLRRRVLPPLPDGDFHIDDPVTRASFYAVVARLLAVFSIGDEPASFFDGGYQWVFTQEAVREGKPAYVSGRDAVSILEKVAAARGNNGG